MHLPQIHQRGLVFPVVHLQPDLIRAIDNGLHNTLNDSTCRQADGNAVAHAELSFVWLLWGWHAKECTLEKGSFSRPGMPVEPHDAVGCVHFTIRQICYYLFFCSAISCATFEFVPTDSTKTIWLGLRYMRSGS